MPTRVNTPFGSRWQPDAFDQGDQFSAQMDQRQRELALARLDRMGDIGRDNDWRTAQLRETGREFDLGREDNAALRKSMLDAHMADLGLAREGLGFQRESAGKEWEYRKGRDDREDAWRKTTYDDDKATRDAQSQMVLAELEKWRKDQERQDKAGNAAPLTSLTPQEQAEQQAAISAGGTQAQANLATLGGRKQRNVDDAETMRETLTKDAAKFSARDNAVVGWDPSETEDNDLVLRARALEKKYVDLGFSPQAARLKAQSAIKDSVQTSANSGHVDFVLKSLGIR